MADLLSGRPGERRCSHGGNLQGAILDIAEPHRKVTRHMLVVFPSCTFVPFVVDLFSSQGYTWRALGHILKNSRRTHAPANAHRH